MSLLTGPRRFYDSLPKQGVVRKTGRSALRLGRRVFGKRYVSPTNATRLNAWQEAFCLWNANRLGIPLDVSMARYRKSWACIKNGHAGEEFRAFAMQQQNLYSVIADDSEAEVYSSYKLHEWMHLLAQLCAVVPTWPDQHPMMQNLREHPRVSIVDFGCGLAQTSISLAQAIRSRGKEAPLFLADIRTVRQEFLRFFCAHEGLSFTLAPCTPQRPLPALPSCHVVVAIEVFEHVHQPIAFFDYLDSALEHGGFLITNVDDHEAEFMHVSPILQSLRERLDEAQYEPIERYRLFRKR